MADDLPKTKEELAEAILATIRAGGGLLDAQASLHYGLNAVVFVFDHDGSRQQGHDFRALLLAYRVSYIPGAAERVARAQELRTKARELQRQAEDLVGDIPGDVIDSFVTPKEKTE